MNIIIVFFCFFLLLSGSAASQQDERNDPEINDSIKIETIRTDKFTMDYFRFGEGKETLVILPGLSVQSVMASADAVVDAYRPLTDDFTIYLFDRRKELPDSYSIYEMAQDTAEAIQAAGLEHVNLFGASQGGMIAMEIAIEHPELVKNLVLGSTSACITAEQYHLFDKWIRLAEEGDAAELYLAFGEALYPKEVFEQSKTLLTELAETVTAEDLKRFVILAKGAENFDITDDLEKIICPVLLLGSADDRVLGAYASEQIAEILNKRPDFEMYMYDGYGHAAYDTAPDYKERMLRFLTKGLQTE